MEWSLNKELQKYDPWTSMQLNSLFRYSVSDWQVGHIKQLLLRRWPCVKCMMGLNSPPVKWSLGLCVMDLVLTGNRHSYLVEKDQCDTCACPVSPFNILALELDKSCPDLGIGNALQFLLKILDKRGHS